MYSFSAFKVLTSVFLIVFTSLSFAETTSLAPTLTDKQQAEQQVQDNCNKTIDEYKEASKKCRGTCKDTIMKCNGNVTSGSTLNTALTAAMMFSGQGAAQPAQQTGPVCSQNYKNKKDAESSYQEASRTYNQAAEAESKAMEDAIAFEEKSLEDKDVLTRKVADMQATCEQQKLSNNDKENQKFMEMMQQQLQQGEQLKAAQQARNKLQRDFNNKYRQGETALKKYSDAAILRECKKDAKTYANTTYKDKNGKLINTGKKDFSSAISSGNSGKKDLKAMLQECINTKVQERRDATAAFEEELADLNKAIQDQDDTIAKSDKVMRQITAQMEAQYNNLKRTNELNIAKCSNQVTAYINEYNRIAAAYPARKAALQSRATEATQMKKRAQNDMTNFDLQRQGVKGMGDDVSGPEAYGAVATMNEIEGSYDACIKRNKGLLKGSTESTAKK